MSMRRVSTFCFIISLLTFVACQTKPKTDEQPADTTTVIATDTTLMTNESSATVPTELDTTAVVADSAKNN